MKFHKKSLIFLIPCLLVIPQITLAEYSEELIQAYNFAYSNGITTMNSIESENMGWNLTRIAMAKMISNYALNILWLQINNNDDCSFSDVSSSLNQDYWYWVTNACKLWLMWQNMPNWKFRPMDIVTRAEFWTTLSRAIHKALKSPLNDWNPYYTPHLNYLNTTKIMNYIDNPEMIEQRWYVMLMMMRAKSLVPLDFDAWECFSDCFDEPENWEFDAMKIYECLTSCIK